MNVITNVTSDSTFKVFHLSPLLKGQGFVSLPLELVQIAAFNPHQPVSHFLAEHYTKKTCGKMSKLYTE